MWASQRSGRGGSQSHHGSSGSQNRNMANTKRRSLIEDLSMMQTATGLGNSLGNQNAMGMMGNPNAMSLMGNSSSMGMIGNQNVLGMMGGPASLMGNPNAMNLLGSSLGGQLMQGSMGNQMTSQMGSGGQNSGFSGGMQRMRNSMSDSSDGILGMMPSPTQSSGYQQQQQRHMGNLGNAHRGFDDRDDHSFGNAGRSSGNDGGGSGFNTIPSLMSDQLHHFNNINILSNTFGNVGRSSGNDGSGGGGGFSAIPPLMSDQLQHFNNGNRMALGGSSFNRGGSRGQPQRRVLRGAAGDRGRFVGNLRDSGSSRGGQRNDGRYSSADVKESGDVLGESKFRSSDEAPTKRRHDNTDNGDLRLTLQSRRVGSATKRSATSTSSDNASNKYHCQVCRVTSATIEDFDVHMSSMSHHQMMDSLNTGMQQNQAAASALHPPELPIENKPYSRDGICTICCMRFFGIYTLHEQSPKHRKRKYLVKKGCVLCKTGPFDNYKEYVGHLDSESHKSNKQELQERLDHKPEEKSVASADSSVSIVPHSTEKDIMKAEADDVVYACDMSDATERAIECRSVGTDSYSADVSVAVKKELEDALDATTAVGEEYVMAVTGYFCKLCRKFFNDKHMTKSAHCLLPSHIDKYKMLRDSESTAFDADQGVDVKEKPIVVLPDSNTAPGDVRAVRVMVTRGGKRITRASLANQRQC